MLNCIKEIILSDDPMSDEAFQFLLNYQEEDSQLDFKESFHGKEEREWLGITKDILSFANTNGGFLLFGIKDGTFERIGLDDNVTRILADSNNILQKVNRFIEPHISLLRCKSYRVNSNNFVVVFIPPSLGKNHIISQDGSFTHQSGKEKIILRKGTSYVRRSGGNHLVDSRDLDDIINRRMEHYRTSLLDKIARVVEAQQESQVFIVSQDPTAEPHSKFVIENAPDSIPVKGMSFTVSPETTEQEIMAWIAMTGRDPEALPSSATTWKWYGARKSLDLVTDQKLQVAKYCLMTEVPVFFWLSSVEAKVIKEMLVETLSYRKSFTYVGDIVSVSAFFGKKFYQSVLNKLDKDLGRLSPIKRNYPTQGPRSFFGGDHLFHKNKTLSKPSNQKENLERELDEISKREVDPIHWTGISRC
ncbi:MAG: hypothetical protein NPIRA02_41640 [Nitrospirales bacterium]|nr:MAG: hypothetical protein NPIRA02_41640 [Nitrospirales bacterium]